MFVNFEKRPFLRYYHWMTWNHVVSSHDQSHQINKNSNALQTLREKKKIIFKGSILFRREKICGNTIRL